MSNPLLVFWQRLFGRPDEPEPEVDAESVRGGTERATATIFLVLRRMRAPLIVLILIFAVSVGGLMIIPGVDAAGQPYRMRLLDAFYVMAYTATTIGYGEIPFAYTPAQRAWVIVSIFLSVIGWAYAIGTLLALIQDREFRQAVATQRFARKVALRREPFLLMAGYGETGRLLGDSLDALDRRFVVLDVSAATIARLDRDAYHSDVPGLAADPANPQNLMAAGLMHPHCEGVLALTDHDEVNLAVVTAASLLRPRLPVVTRAFTALAAERMRTHGAVVINPFDAFGDHLRLAVQAPSSYQLLQWVTSLPGDPAPERRAPVEPGRWVVAGYGRFGQEVTADLRAGGVEVTVVDAGTTESHDPDVVVETGSEEDMVRAADVASAAGLIAANDDDVTNLGLVTAARAVNHDVFVVARRNRQSNEALFDAVHADLVLVPPEVTAHEVLVRLGSPVLLRFVREVYRRGDEWAGGLLARLVRNCGRTSIVTWQVDLTDRWARGISEWLREEGSRVGDLLRDPQDRNQPVSAVVLMVVRGTEDVCAPDDEFRLEPGDSLLLAGTPEARRDLAVTLVDEATREYVLHGREIPSGWLWRKLARDRDEAREPATAGRSRN